MGSRKLTIFNISSGISPVKNDALCFPNKIIEAPAHFTGTVKLQKTGNGYNK